MMSRMVVYLAAASVLVAWAAAACNTLQAAENSFGDCNCTDPSLLYDYSENVCKNESEVFVYGGYGPFGDENGCKSGFTKNATTQQCDDNDECALGTHDCSTLVVCHNTNGSFHCGCSDRFFSTGGSCVNIDESLNPLWNDCPQRAYDRAPGYKCGCFNTTMFNDTAKDGRACELKPEYTDCTKSTDKGVVCVEETASGAQFFFAEQGYQLDALNKPEDKNECLNPSKTLCWDNADCKNNEDGGGYNCTCRPGYTDELFTGDVKECLPTECGRGEGEACFDPCVDYSECQQDKICVVPHNLPTCLERLDVAIFNKPLSVHLFTNSIEIWNSKDSPALVTQSLETVFGTGNVQVLPDSPESQTFTSYVLQKMTQSDVNERLQSYCVSLAQLPGYCELPAGVIIQVPTNFTLVEDVCAEGPCPDTHNCHVNTRTCSCKEGNTNEFFHGIFEICEFQIGCTDGSLTTTVEASSTEQFTPTTDGGPTTTVEASSTEQFTPTTEGKNWRDVATDLQEQLIAAEDSLKVTAAVLGTLLGLALVVIVVLVCFKKGQFFAS